MKTNLKNRPQGVKDCVSTSEYYMKAQRWFEDFEKELRESLNWLETMWHPRNDVQKAKREAYIDEINAILGEE